MRQLMKTLEIKRSAPAQNEESLQAGDNIIMKTDWLSLGQTHL